MTVADDALRQICDSYQEAVSAGDSAAYRELFAPDAIRIPPGSDPEHGPDEIARSEQKDYDVATWTIQPTPLDALQISDDWVYGVAHIDVTTTAHADGATNSFGLTITWLLERQSSEVWLIKRQIWNLK